MNTGLGPAIKPEIAKSILDLFGTVEVEVSFVRLLADYRDQLYERMLVAPDDQLAGYRGMLLCINNLLFALQRPELKKVIDKAKSNG